MKQATGNKGIDWVEDQKLSDLDFADYIAALSNNTQDLQEFVNAIGETAGGLGLVISNKKTKNMLAGEHRPPHDMHDVFIGQRDDWYRGWLYVPGKFHQQPRGNDEGD